MTLTYIILAVLIFIALFSPFTVKQQTVKIVQRLGKFNRVARTGLNFRIPLIDSLVGTLDLRVQQINLVVNTKSKDNVFVDIGVSVQYFVDPSKAYEAFYKLEDPIKQISSFVYDVVRSKVPTLNLDDVFLQKQDIATGVKSELDATMSSFGYEIMQALVIDINPDQKVKDSMNEIQSAQRMQIANLAKGESEKILIVKAAEAQAESKALQGKGVADERKAIVEGLKSSVSGLSDALGVNEAQVMNILMLTQYLDTIKEIGTKGSTIFLPNSPSAVSSMAEEIRTAIISAQKVK